MHAHSPSPSSPIAPTQPSNEKPTVQRTAIPCPSLDFTTVEQAAELAMVHIFRLPPTTECLRVTSTISDLCNCSGGKAATLRKHIEELHPQVWIEEPADQVDAEGKRPRGRPAHLVKPTVLLRVFAVDPMCRKVQPSLQPFFQRFRQICGLPEPPPHPIRVPRSRDSRSRSRPLRDKDKPKKRRSKSNPDNRTANEGDPRIPHDTQASTETQQLNEHEPAKPRPRPHYTTPRNRKRTQEQSMALSTLLDAASIENNMDVALAENGAEVTLDSAISSMAVAAHKRPRLTRSQREKRQEMQLIQALRRAGLGDPLFSPQAAKQRLHLAVGMVDDISTSRPGLHHLYVNISAAILAFEHQRLQQAATQLSLQSPVYSDAAMVSNPGHLLPPPILA